MNEREVSELRRRFRPDKTNIAKLCGCYVSDKGEILSQFTTSIALMLEDEKEKVLAVLKKALSGTLGKNLMDISFPTKQVVEGAEHKLLQTLRTSRLEDQDAAEQFYQKVISTVSFETNYLILLAYDAYDVPFKGKDGSGFADGSDQVFSYILCSICPVKLSKSGLSFHVQDQEFHNSKTDWLVSAPELGFLFPAFDNRATNIYNALMYTHDSAKGHEAFVESVFNTNPTKPAAEQKKSFEALLSATLGEECSMEVVQTVHDQLCQAIDLHKESRVAEPLMISREQVSDALKMCAVSEQSMAKFNVEFDETFGGEAQLHPKNIIDNKKFEIHTPDVSIRVDPARSDLIETRIIGGVKYILICADEDVEVNGVSIHIGEREKAEV